jgi:alpha-N-arabinofuranosidase
MRNLRILVNVFLIAAASLCLAQPQATITIDAGKTVNSISPILFGQFAEFMYEDVKFGLWAELLRDRSFEEAADAHGLPRYWERDPDDRNDDAIKFAQDNSVSVNRPADATQQTHSLRIDIPESNGQRRGIRQGGLPVRSGVAYHGSVWIKNGDYSGHVTVALEQDRTEGQRYAAAEINVSSGDWRKYEFTLAPNVSDPLAKVAVLFYGKGRLWVDQISLMPGDAAKGVRRDVYERIRDEHPAFIRWPGGNVAQDYHWQWGIGERDQRPVWVNLSWANELEPSDFGTDEYIAFCRSIGAEPTLVVNVEGRGATAEEAARWVEYVNGSASTAMGRVRAQNGHAEPYNVKLWEIGNEIWGDWVRGHSDAQTYANNLNRYVAAMRAVDPSLKFIAVGDNDMNWNRTVLRVAGRNIDYLAIHHYYGLREMQGDRENLMAHPLHYERFYREVQEAIRELVPGRGIKLAINEWNTNLPVPRQHSMESALYAARLMNVFERSGDVVAMSAPSDMVNGWSGGLIQASRHDVFVTPTYLAVKLYNDHLGTARLAATVAGPIFNTTREGSGVPYLDVVATRSSDGGSLFIHAVNTNLESAIAARIKIAGARISSQAEIETLIAPTLEAANSFRTPEAVRVGHRTVNAGADFSLDLPAHSVSMITLHVTQ